MSTLVENWYIQAENEPSIVGPVLEYLEQNGYKPLITRAKEAFIVVLGETQSSSPAPTIISSSTVSGLIGKGQLAAGDVFRANAEHGIFYLAFFRGGGLLHHPRLQVGAMGDSATIQEFKKFFDLVKASHPETTELKWSRLSIFSTRFVELSKDTDVKFVLGSSISTSDLELSKVMEGTAVRSLATRIKSSGGILESDLAKNRGLSPEGTEAALRELDDADLLAREHVIICRKSSNQVNRVDNPQKVEQMSKMGVLCSCGAPIENERLERFLRPSDTLIRLLDGSFWMTARLLEVLTRQGISTNRILLTVQQGTEELDAFVDVDGTLLLFEMKDSIFSMGHAYSFGARLGLYKPKFGIVLTTKGVAPEVRTHFERIKPDARIIYIEQLEDLEKAAADIVESIHSEWAIGLLSEFDPLARVNISLADNLGRQIGLPVETIRKKAPSNLWVDWSHDLNDSLFTWSKSS
jgi:hypothetical protein